MVLSKNIPSDVYMYDILSQSRFMDNFVSGLMMTVIRVAYSGKLQYRKKIHKIMQFSEQKQLTPQLTKKLIDYYRFKYRNTITNEDFILRNISMKMRQVFG